MFCTKCGSNIPDNAQFCPDCGNRPEKVIFPEPYYTPPEMDKTRKKSKNKVLIPVIICVSLLLIFAAAGAGAWYFLFFHPKAQARECIKQAEQYMDDEKYERAVSSYQDALNYDEKNETAYLGMAEAYAKMENYKKAVQTLENGLNVISSKKLEDALEEMNTKYEASKNDILQDDGGDIPDDDLRPAEPVPPPQEEQYGGSFTGGNTFNIYCYNEEFLNRIEDHYSDYERIDDRTGKIGNVTVRWNIIPVTMGDEYQNSLDAALFQDGASDSAVDIFIVEPDYALKYINTDYTMPISSLGITENELSDQYPFTKDVGTDSSGVLKGVAWQACPTVLIYNRKIAKNVLGTDDPDAVQQYVGSWDSYKKTAGLMASSGYKMTASPFDTARIYMNNVSSPWVKNDVLDIDDHMKEWADDTKGLVSNGVIDKCSMWSGDWARGFYGNTFCYFGPPWFYDYCMDSYETSSVAYSGGWGACCGPEPGFWGGVWICVGKNCDNMDIAADIIRQLTTDKDTMADMFYDDNDFVNSRTVMEYMASNGLYSSPILGGQNALIPLCKNADMLRISNATPYDDELFGEFQGSMWEYFIGNISYNDAADSFKATIKSRHAELK